MKFEIHTRTSGYDKPEHQVQIIRSGTVIAEISGVQSAATGEPSAKSMAEALVDELESELIDLRRQLEEIK